MIGRYDLSKHLGDLSRRSVGDGNTPPMEQRKLNYDRERAYQFIFNDYMSLTPLFDDKQFQRVFRIKRTMVDEIISDLASLDAFWTSRRDATGKLSHSPVVKFLMGQKMLCYGVFINAFKDYFQMGKSTGNLCLSKLCFGIVNSPKYS